jgi:FkbM family methyltransferase
MGNVISWLKESEGLTISDKLLVFFIKVFYLNLRIIMRIALGKKRRDRLYRERGLDFADFLYKAVKFFRPKSKLLKFKVPKYNYKFYCRTNKDDFVVMTIREDHIIEHFTPRQGDVVVDIGAHIGRYTIISSKRVGAKGKVVAIEANPDNYEMLNSNIQLNQLTNIIPLNYAVYSKETKIKLYRPGEESGNTIYNTTMVLDRAKVNEKFVEVNADTLDNLLQENGIEQQQINWIKIDVEGAEFEVLKGATTILSKSKDIALLIEVHNLSGGINLYRPILEFLKSFNFKIEFEKTYDSGEKHIIVRKQP